MGKTLNEITMQLIKENKKVQLIYGFNGIGKTRLSKEFKAQVSSGNQDESSELRDKEIIYYNAFTEDLFYWDNDLKDDVEPRLIIRPNAFTKWIFEEQGQEANIVSFFKNYTNSSITPRFNDNYTAITFPLDQEGESTSKNIKISKGEESNLVWSLFYSLLKESIEELDIVDDSDLKSDRFANLKYVFIDDPVTSLDDNHLIQLAVDLSSLIKKSKSGLKFIITTHNPLFYNVLANEFKNDDKKLDYKRRRDLKKYTLDKSGDNTYDLNNTNDAPFSYHIFLLTELINAVETDEIYKHHFNFLRNVFEKSATFLGYNNWSNMLSFVEGDEKKYVDRILNISSHSKHSAEETYIINDDDKRILKYLLKGFIDTYKFDLEIKENK